MILRGGLSRVIIEIQSQKMRIMSGFIHKL